MFWLNHFHNLLWLRNHIVAPLSEEFTFRACMLPLLLQSFTPMTSIFITPIFFGVGKFNKSHWNCKINKIFFSTSPSHDWTTKKRNGSKDCDFNFTISVLLHINLWDILSISLRENWTFCCALHCTCFLQSHGIPRHPRSPSTGWAKTLRFSNTLRSRSYRIYFTYSNHDWSKLV